jgi:hypothetical protein
MKALLEQHAHLPVEIEKPDQEFDPINILMQNHSGKGKP